MVKDSDDELSEIDPILKAEIMEMQACPKCGSTRIMRDYECAEIVCMNCGFVVNQKIAYREWKKRTFNGKQKTKRASVGAPLTYTIHDKGLTTVIDWHNRDSRGKNFSVEQKAQVYRLRKWQRRIRITGSTERNLTYALSEMMKISNKLNLPKNILEAASIIYRKTVKEHLINGHSIRGIATATLYLACRQYGPPKTLDEIARASAVNKKELGKSYRFLIKKLDYSIPPLQPNQCIIKFSNKVTVQRKVEKIVYKILTASKDIKLTSGRTPTGIAAAAGYVALVLIGERKTQKEIADIAQITEGTIRNRYKEIVNRLMFEISL
ncbi:MAG: transcription initiation factor IIB [Nitrososphaerota archaeon]|jgi:transcription initiation factor TFIIB|nr:transcription initiation factor IIB [Nitrososphaerota archaeon]